MIMRSKVLSPRTGAACIVAVLVAALAFGFAPRILAQSSRYGPPSRALVQVLRSIQALNWARTTSLQDWARGAAQPPSNPFFPQEHVEVQIGSLARSDRSAVLSWLRGEGRTHLYRRGASDTEIGPCKKPIDNASCASHVFETTQRTLQFALAPTDPASNIEIERGFAVVSKDGTEEVHCLTFKNVATKTATQVTFGWSYYAHGGAGEPLEHGTNVRTGTFSPGITIAGPSDYSGYQDATSGIGHSGLKDNCWKTKSQVARLSAVQAGTLAMTVRSVQYADGTSWTAP
jgi:hypothetical protein